MEKDNKSLIDGSLYNEKTLSILNIKDLRDLGRKLGVPSPTTKNKQQLVDYILKIVYGEIEIPERSVYGRPNVREFDFNKYVDKIQKNSVLSPEKLSFNFGYNKTFVSTLSSPTKSYDFAEKIVQRVYLKKNGKHYLKEHAFVDNEQDIEITQELAEKYKLEDMDILEVIVKGDLFKVISINGIKYENKQKNDLYGKSVKEGTKQVFHLRTKEEIKENILKIENECVESNTNLLIFSKSFYNNKKTHTMCYDDSDNNAKTYKNLMQFISLCEKYVYQNEEIVVIIDETSEIEKSIESFEEDVSERIQKHLTEKVKTFIELGNTLIIYKLDKPVTY